MIHNTHTHTQTHTHTHTNTHTHTHTCMYINACIMTSDLIYIPVL